MGLRLASIKFKQDCAALVNDSSFFNALQVLVHEDSQYV